MREKGIIGASSPNYDPSNSSDGSSRTQGKGTQLQHNHRKTVAGNRCSFEFATETLGWLKTRQDLTTDQNNITVAWRIMFLNDMARNSV